MELAAAENTLLAFDPTRSHLSHIAQMFANGDFSTPMFMHDGVPPGATTMKLMKSAIHYTYEERTKALLADIVEDPGEPGVDGSPDHVVALALEVVTVCLYFSRPQIPLLNGPGLAPRAALRDGLKKRGSTGEPLYDEGQQEAGKSK